MSLLSELVTVKCWKYRSRNRGGLLHSDTNGQLWWSLHLNGAFLFISSITQLRFTNVPDRRQLADTKNGRAKVPPPWSVYSERGPSLEGHFRKLLTLNNVSFMHSVSVALSVMYPLIHPLPLSRLVLLSLFTEWGGRSYQLPSAYQIWLVIGLFWHITTFIISSHISSLVFFGDSSSLYAPEWESSRF